MSVRRALFDLVRSIPAGHVASIDDLAVHLKIPPTHAALLLARLTEDEREMTPWHRVVASGGAIGRGPHRDAQFARLAREGVPVSPAGVVQDMARVCIVASALARGSVSPRETSSAAPASRSRGMKDRP